MIADLDSAQLEERAAVMTTHLQRVEEHRPKDPTGLRLWTDPTDSVIYNLGQAIQVALNTALSACLEFRLGSPPTYAAGLEVLAEARLLDPQLKAELIKAAKLRYAIIRSYEDLDMDLLSQAATHGPDHLRAFLGAMARALDEYADES